MEEKDYRHWQMGTEAMERGNTPREKEERVTAALL
jgi:hypothetical protein